MMRTQNAMVMHGKLLQTVCLVTLILACLGISYRSLHMPELSRSHHSSTSDTLPVPPTQNTNLPSGLTHHKTWQPFDYDAYSDYTPEDLYHTRMNEPNTIVCWDHIRLGSLTDGGWDMCIAGPYLPKKNDCLIYSFGINDDWSFDDAVSETFECHVRAFDPSMETYPNNSRRGDTIDFYQLGLSGTDEMKTFPGHSSYYPVRTLGTLRRYFNDDKKVIDYLKIDIEGSEWQTLSQVLDEGVLQQYVKQFALEYHGSERESNLIHEQIRTLDRLEEVGFRRWLLHWNMNCRLQTNTGHGVTYCYEAYYINTKFIQLNVEI